jgi:hypothetical protein
LLVAETSTPFDPLNAIVFAVTAAPVAALNEIPFRVLPRPETSDAFVPMTLPEMTAPAEPY